MLRFGVAGALGRLGRVACTAVEAAEDLELASTFSRGDDLRAFAASGVELIVHCPVYPVTRARAPPALDAGVPVVIGATGWSDDELRVLRARSEESGVPAMFVPNFSFGAVLMMRFAAQAARVMPRAEIIELHHDAKRDAPSGTAKLTAQRIREAGAPLPPIHSVRLPGLLAHQEPICGGTGERLTLHHDSLSRESFGPGIVAAVRAVRNQTGLVIGLDAIVNEKLAACD